MYMVRSCKLCECWSKETLECCRSSDLIIFSSISRYSMITNSFLFNRRYVEVLKLIHHLNRVGCKFFSSINNIRNGFSANKNVIHRRGILIGQLADAVCWNSEHPNDANEWHWRISEKIYSEFRRRFIDLQWPIHSYIIRSYREIFDTIRRCTLHTTDKNAVRFCFVFTFLAQHCRHIYKTMNARTANIVTFICEFE